MAVIGSSHGYLTAMPGVDSVAQRDAGNDAGKHPDAQVAFEKAHLCTGRFLRGGFTLCADAACTLAYGI
jgi:hypothetical protein